MSTPSNPIQSNPTRRSAGEKPWGEGGSMISHGFTLQRSQSSISWFSGRSKRYDGLRRDSLFPDRLIPLPGYQKLSKSMRFLSEEGEPTPQPWPGGWAREVMRRVFSFRKEGGGGGGGGLSVPEEKRKKKRSSWLPDPDRRWPVQGW